MKRKPDTLLRSSHPTVVALALVAAPLACSVPQVYSAVASSNRVVAAIGKAWADTASPFRWHQAEANRVFGPAGRGWDAQLPPTTVTRHLDLLEAWDEQERETVRA